MKTEWDYTDLADAYLQRPDYSSIAIDSMLSIAGIGADSKVCDVGAGVAHLTLMLAARMCDVVAVEPNDAMRAIGIERTRALKNVVWHEGTGEDTGQQADTFDLVTFGSSFNVCDRASALAEAATVLKPAGWFACMWNHRQLDDPIQSEIEAIIRNQVAGYGYGTRRQDQSEIIAASGLFDAAVHLSSGVIHEQSVHDCVKAWRSHATLERQAGDNFARVVSEIDSFLRGLKVSSIPVPYRTNIWIAKRS